MVNSNKISEIKIVLEGLLKEVDSLSETGMVSHLKWEDIFISIDMVKQKLNTLRIEQEIAILSREVAELKCEVERRGISQAETIEEFDLIKESDTIERVEETETPNEDEEPNGVEETDNYEDFNDLDISDAEWMLDETGPHVDDIYEAMTINDKIYFVNELFNGDEMQYHQCLQQLNDFSSLREALVYTREIFSDKSEDSPEIYRFYMILRRRYDE